MYFSEQYLKGAKIDDTDMEGNYQIPVGMKFVEAIKDLQNDPRNSGHEGNLSKIKSQLEFGVELFEIITQASHSFRTSFSSLDFSEQLKEGKVIQKRVTDYFEKPENEAIIMPSGWVGHAIVLVLKRSSSDTNEFFDLAVINSGSGINYHHKASDPNHISPYLTRLWMEFKNIPREEIFSPSAWFFNGLAALQSKNVTDNIRKNFEGGIQAGGTYFYSSFLASLKDYVVPIEEGKSWYFSDQRSGSCSVSSIHAALAYMSHTKEEYYMIRILIGQAILDKFLNNYSNHPGFLKIITDGFETDGRRLFKVIVSSLALQALEYLEIAFPDEFNHAGLLGAGRSSWVFTKKNEAIEKLNKHPEIVAVLRKSISLGSKIVNVLKKNPINPESTRLSPILALNPMKIPYKNQKVSLGENKDDLKTESKISTITNGKYSKKAVNIKSFADFFEATEAFLNPDSKNQLYQMTEILKGLYENFPNMEWLNVVCDTSDAERLLALQNKFSNIIASFAFGRGHSISFDDIVTVSMINLIVWKIAVKYDEMKEEKNSLGISEANPPGALHATLRGEFDRRFNFFGSSTRNFYFYNVFDAINYKIFHEIDNFFKNYPRSSFFCGPENFRNLESKNTWSQIRSIAGCRFFHKLIKHESAVNIYDRLKNQRSEKANKYWNEADYNTAMLEIVLIEGKNELEKQIEHFYILMDSLAALMFSIFPRNCEEDIFADFWLSGYPKYEYRYSLKNATETIANPEQFLQRLVDPFPIFDFLDSSDQNYGDEFYKMSHSSLLSANFKEKVYFYWLAHIRGHKSGKLFDSLLYQIQTDQLLNIPKIADHKQIAFPVNGQLARDIIFELLRLVKNILSSLVTDQTRLDDDKISRLMARSMVISLIGTRFISRVDSEKLLHADECAENLAEFYNLLAPFANYYQNLIKIDKEDTARFNLILTTICTARLRNAVTFMNSVNLGFSFDGPKLRTALARYHWFATMMNFLKSDSVHHKMTDRQFIYGFAASPVAKEEHNFLVKLITNNYITGKIEGFEAESIHFGFHGRDDQILRIQSSNHYILLNLASGVIFINGTISLTKSDFLNFEDFNILFQNEKDMSAIKEATIFEESGTKFLVPSEIDGVQLVLTISHDSKNSPIHLVHRKWNGNWYLKILAIHIETIHAKLKYAHMKDKMIFIRKTSTDDFEIAIFGRYSRNPEIVLRHGPDNLLKLSIPGLFKNQFLIVQEAESSEKHFDIFSQRNQIFARTENDETVVIFPGLRLSESPDRPVALKQVKNDTDNENKGKYDVANVTNMFVKLDQGLSDGYTLKGTLIASMDQKKVLLVPFRESETRINGEQNHEADTISPVISQIYSIPIVENSPSPKTRTHRLLLAYHALMHRNYDLTYELLHPAKSCHHNEPFTNDELQIFDWIINIDSDAPEANALRYLSLAHILINSIKFKLHIKESNLYSKYSRIKKEIALFFFQTLRRIPEKYYIYRLFPELVQNENLAFYFIESEVCIGGGIQSSNISSIRISCNVPTATTWEIGSPIDEDLFKLLVTKNPNQETIEIVKKLMNRNFTSSNNLEVEYLCIVMRNNFGLEIRDKVCQMVKPGFKNYDNDEILTKYMRAILKDCKSSVQNIFFAANQSEIFTCTNTSEIRSTLLDDLKTFELRLASSPENQLQHIKIAPISDVKQFDELRRKLSLLISTNGMDWTDQLHFNSELSSKSRILTDLADSIKSFKNESSSLSIIQVPVSISILENFKNFLDLRITELNNNQVRSTEELISLAHSSEKATTAVWIAKLVEMMHAKPVKVFEHLYSCYTQNTLACIQSKFPQLNLAQCIKMREKAFLFFSRQILIDYYSMISKIMVKFVESSSDGNDLYVDDIKLLCDELGKLEDFNDRIKSPVVLLFEFRSRKYRMKGEQVKDLIKLTDKSDNNSFKSIVIQRMMAAGKTLVLGTLSVIKKAFDKSQLSILVPPSSLYQSNTVSMQNRTYNYFKKTGSTILFSRLPKLTGEFDKDELTLSFLNDLLRTLMNTVKQSNYLILSPDTLHAILNSYIETIMETTQFHDQSGPQLMALRLMSQIYHFFKTRGSIILDEIDMTMDPKKELNYPTQESESFNMIAVMLIADIFEFMIFDHGIIDAGLSIHSNSQASLTGDQYRQCLDKILKYIEEQFDDTKSIWALSLLGNQEDSNNVVNNIMAFLKDPDVKSGKSWITAFYNSGQKMAANALIILKIQLHQYLYDSLKGTVNLNFGSAGAGRPEILYAVPFLAANTPSSTSVFADRWETLTKTLLMVSAVTCTDKVAEKMIDFIKSEITDESIYMNISFENTVMYKNVMKILRDGVIPLKMSSSKPQHIRMMQNALACRSPAAIRIIYSYYIKVVFANMTFPILQITSSALHMTSMFASVQGYSGTIDNVNILPQNVIKEAHKDHLANEKYNGGIAYKLIADFSDAIIPELDDILFGKSISEMVNGLFKAVNANIDKLSAIIDVGAFFKNFKNREIAEEVLKYFVGSKEVALYYDEVSNQLEYSRISFGDDGSFSISHGNLDTSDPDEIFQVTQSVVEKRFTFYDQRHITGSDILQPKFAHALLTISPRTLLRDILQGTLRMRQFMSSQKVSLIASKSTVNYFNENFSKNLSINIKTSDLLSLGAMNEDEKQRSENVKLAYLKIGAEIRDFILYHISILGSVHSTNIDAIKKLFASAKTLFVRSIEEVPMQWLDEAQNETPAQALKLYAISLLAPVKKVIEEEEAWLGAREDFEKVQIRIARMVSEKLKDEPDSLLYYLRDLELMPMRLNSDNGSEMELQMQSMTLVDLNLEVLVDSKPSNAMENVYLSDLINLMTAGAEAPKSLINFSDIVDSYKNHPGKGPIISSAFLTNGTLVSATKDLTDPVRNVRGIFSRMTDEGTNLIVLNDTQNDIIRVILASGKQYQRFCDNYKALNGNVNRHIHFWACDLTGEVFMTNYDQEALTQNVLDFIPETRSLIFDALIFNGSLNQIYSSDILKTIFYEDWLKSSRAKDRAIFLLLRMSLLRSKINFVFDEGDPAIQKLRANALGISGSKAEEKYIGSYPKRCIDDHEEAKGRTLHLINTNLEVELKSQMTTIFKDEFDFDKDPAAILGFDDKLRISGNDVLSIGSCDSYSSLNIHDLNSDNSIRPIEAPKPHSIIKMKDGSKLKRNEQNSTVEQLSSLQSVIESESTFTFDMSKEKEEFDNINLNAYADLSFRIDNKPIDDKMTIIEKSLENEYYETRANFEDRDEDHQLEFDNQLEDHSNTTKEESLNDPEVDFSTNLHEVNGTAHVEEMPITTFITDPKPEEDNITNPLIEIQEGVTENPPKNLINTEDIQSDAPTLSESPKEVLDPAKVKNVPSISPDSSEETNSSDSTDAESDETITRPNSPINVSGKVPSETDSPSNPIKKIDMINDPNIKPSTEKPSKVVPNNTIDENSESNIASPKLKISDVPPKLPVDSTKTNNDASGNLSSQKDKTQQDRNNVQNESAKSESSIKNISKAKEESTSNVLIIMITLGIIGLLSVAAVVMLKFKKHQNSN